MVEKSDDWYPVKEDLLHVGVNELAEETAKQLDIEEDKKVVNHPQRYGGDTTYECIKVLKAWNSPEEFIGFCKDNTIKYLCRVGKKDDVLQDYKKAQWYLNQLIEYLENK